jgi:aldehyde dehydrogenase (NAD+)
MTPTSGTWQKRWRGRSAWSAGQICSSLTRIIVSRSRHDEFVHALSESFSRLSVGDPFDPSSDMGPLADRRQRDRVEGHIAKGIEQGAKLVTGGRRPRHLSRGYYVEPTVVASVDNRQVIAQEEIFGPVLSVIRLPTRQMRYVSPTTRSTGSTRRCSQATLTAPARPPASSDPAPLDTTRSAPTSGSPSAASSSRASAAKAGTEAIRLFTEPKTLILKGTPARYRS